MSENDMIHLLWSPMDEATVELECDVIEDRVFAVAFSERDCWGVHSLASL